MSDEDDLILARIVITRTLESDTGEDNIGYQLSDGLTIIEVLGMIRLAEIQLVDALCGQDEDDE